MSYVFYISMHLDAFAVFSAKGGKKRPKIATCGKLGHVLGNWLCTCFFILFSTKFCLSSFHFLRGEVGVSLNVIWLSLISLPPTIRTEQKEREKNTCPPPALKCSPVILITTWITGRGQFTTHHNSGWQGNIFQSRWSQEACQGLIMGTLGFRLQVSCAVWHWSKSLNWLALTPFLSFERSLSQPTEGTALIWILIQWRH